MKCLPSLGYLKPINAELSGIQKYYMEEISPAAIYQLSLLKFPKET